MCQASLCSVFSLVYDGESEDSEMGKTVEWTDLAGSVLSRLDDIVKNIQRSRQSFKGLEYEFCLECDICSNDTETKCLVALKDAEERCRKCPNSKGEHCPSKLYETAWVKTNGKQIFQQILIVHTCADSQRELSSPPYKDQNGSYIRPTYKDQYGSYSTVCASNGIQTIEREHR